MTQAQLKTPGNISCVSSLTGQAMFTVSPNIPVLDALEQASIMQDCATRLMNEAALGHPTGYAALSAVYLNEMAKALMDDVARAMGSAV